MIRNAALVLAAALVTAGAPATLSVRGDPATLSVRAANGRTLWWREDRAPTRWESAHPTVTRAIEWHRDAPGVDRGELLLEGDGEAWRTRVIIARLDPRHVRFEVQWGVDSEAQPAWSIAKAPANVRFAVNAGQFTAALPWGWVVINEQERLAPGRGPLSSAFIIDRRGAVRLWDGDSLADLRRSDLVAAAFQSYPSLLIGDGIVPTALRAPCAINCTHRDARLALGLDRNGYVIVALTRFDAGGEALGFIPLGLTVPEMAALMGALGARQAMLLDGGISAQMLVRDARGAVRTWRGVRRVPLGLMAVPR